MIKIGASLGGVRHLVVDYVNPNVKQNWTLVTCRACGKETCSDAPVMKHGISSEYIIRTAHGGPPSFK